ncbi:BrnA antitoxin family protein [Moorena producens JHB]|uniref:BrnA antitoxin family protein n=1 Tax=Moorena producens (strain JHB) TaxID=1454205 RepID=A0A9Q9UVF3_MOOP1|nr:BrnA antitoxin family protein [Moorena producens]WAN68764.1 BrnA antitoxin family protein [Moorena producens JHB]
MEAEYDFSKGKRGAIDPMPSGKTRITITLDNDVLEWFRDQVNLSGGGNYQTLINQVLRQHIQHQLIELEGVQETIPRTEIVQSQEAWENYRSGNDKGISSKDLKRKLLA